MNNVATNGIDAVELVLQILLKYEQDLNLEGKEIDIQDLRETTYKFTEEYKNRKDAEIVSQIINEAINQFEEFKNNKEKENN